MSKPSNLVIVESPSKAKTIGKYLGPDYIVKASMGHLRDLPKSKMGVDLEQNFEPQYIPVRGKEDLIKELKKDAAAVGTVYLATDPDREGEAISWHLKELLQLPDEKAKRVTFNEITQKVVRASIQTPRDIDYDLVDASRPGESWTGSWAISCPRCCGKRFGGVCLPAVFSPWPPAWWWIGKMRSGPSSPESTGPWM